MSKPRGLLEESFQYCRGPTLSLRMTLLNALVEETWRTGKIVQDLAAEGRIALDPPGASGPQRYL